ncbi:MAG: hypothetical protein ABJN22_09960 [Litorimonas sp.]
MTEKSLKLYLRISGWAAILTVSVEYALTLIQRNIRMADFEMDAAFRTQTNLLYTVGFGFELPFMLTLACLCLMAARVLAFKQQTLQSVFE